MMKSLTSPRIFLLAAVAALLFATTISANAQTLTTFANLTTTSGQYPLTPLVQGFDGNLYGTTTNAANGFGSFIQVTPSGAVTPLYSFCPNYNDNYPCADGAYPQGSVALGTDGNFYGVTTEGYYSSTGNGTIYKVTPSGAFTKLHTFCALTDCADGANPTLGLTLSRSGDFYGLSNAPNDSSAFYGQVFTISSSGTFHNLLTVCPNTLCPTNAGPIGSLLLTSGGALMSPGPGVGYGNGPGAIYSMSPSGVPRLLYQFCDDSTCHDGGGYNRTPLAQSPSGQIYGTFTQGGVGASCAQNGGCGTAFRVTSAGVFTKLHDFCSQTACADGFNPNALILASDGNLYGTTGEGGKHGYGTLFRITSTGHFSVVHSFTQADGSAPTAIPLLQGTDGNLYGATVTAIYRVSLGLPPFVKTVQNAVTVGGNVIILGNNLTGTTSVTFNGTSASFTVVSDTEITATVPSGATTGTIKVVTPSATLSSNVAFEVLP
jgi:uncharacterized repeat protein (TIGR03803 family)